MITSRNTSQNSAFTGADDKVTIDTTKRCLVIHDGVPHPLPPLPGEGVWFL